MSTRSRKHSFKYSPTALELWESSYRFLSILIWFMEVLVNRWNYWVSMEIMYWILFHWFWNTACIDQESVENLSFSLPLSHLLSWSDAWTNCYSWWLCVHSCTQIWLISRYFVMFFIECQIILLCWIVQCSTECTTNYRQTLFIFKQYLNFLLADFIKQKLWIV